MPAPHFYIELLRQRLTSPKLEVEEVTCRVDYAYETAEEPALLVALVLSWQIRNVGRVVATHWAVNIRHLSWPDNVDFRARATNDVLSSNYPAPKTPVSRNSGIRVGSRAILPDCAYTEEVKFALRLRPVEQSAKAVADDLWFIISNLTLKYQIATESSPGEPGDLALVSICDRDRILAAIQTQAPGFFEG